MQAEPLGAARRFARWAVRRYYPRIDIEHGERIPQAGPVLLCANHANSLLDPLIIGIAARRPVRFMARAPLFDVPIMGATMRALGMVPAYRGMDDKRQVRRNLASLEAGAAVLAAGRAMGIFPEGLSTDRAQVAKIRGGAARMALQALGGGAEALCIVPLGITYERKERFRSAVLVRVAEPVDPAAHLAAADGNVARARRTITEELDARIKEVAVHLENADWEPWLDDLEILAPAGPTFDAASSGMAARRETGTGMRREAGTGARREAGTGARREAGTGARREAGTGVAQEAGTAARHGADSSGGGPLGSRLRRSTAPLRQRKRIADAINHFWQHDRARAESVGAEVKAYRDAVAAAGLRVDSEVLATSGLGVLMRLLARFAWLGLLFVPALLGTLHHLVPFVIVRRLAAWLDKVGRTTTATHRLMLGVPIYALWLAAVTFALWLWRPWVAWVWLPLAPFAGVLALHYWRRARATSRLLYHETRALLQRRRLIELRARRDALRDRLRRLADDFDRAR